MPLLSVAARISSICLDAVGVDSSVKRGLAIHQLQVRPCSIIRTISSACQRSETIRQRCSLSQILYSPSASRAMLDPSGVTVMGVGSAVMGVVA